MSITLFLAMLAIFISPTTGEEDPGVAMHVVSPRYRNSLFSSWHPENVKVELTLPKNIGANVEVSVAISDDPDPVVWQTTIKVASATTMVEIPIAVFDHVSTYFIRALVVDGVGREHEATTFISRRAPSANEVAIDDQNRLRINGQPVFPIVVWGTADPNWIQDMDVTMYCLSGDYRASDFDVHAPAALRRDLPMFCQARSHARSDFINQPDKAIEEVKRHFEAYSRIGSIVSWMIADEPEYHETYSHQGLEEIHDVLVKLDPYRPTAICNNTSRGIDLYGDIPDILMVDPYLDFRQDGSVRPMRYVGEMVQTARARVKDEKPVWVILQAFAMRPKGGRTPTIQEERCMAFQALVNGAKGIFFYAMRCGHMKYYWTQDPLFWEQMKILIRELNYLTPALLSRDHMNIVVDDESIQWLARRTKDHLYLLVVNPTSDAKTVRFRFQEPTGSNWHVLAESRNVEVRNKEFTDDFEPYGVHVYTTDQDPIQLDYEINVIPMWEQKEHDLGLTNVALYQRGGTITYSRIPDQLYYREGLIDGDFQKWNRWSGDPKATYPQWAEVSFDGKKLIRKIVVQAHGTSFDYGVEYHAGDVWHRLTRTTARKLIYDLEEAIETDRLKIIIYNSEFSITQIDAYGEDRGGS